MIRVYYHFGTIQEGAELKANTHARSSFPVVAYLRSGQCLTCIGLVIMLLVLALAWHCSDGVIIRNARGLERKFPIGRMYDG